MSERTEEREEGAAANWHTFATYNVDLVWTFRHVFLRGGQKVSSKIRVLATAVLAYIHTYALSLCL